MKGIARLFRREPRPRQRQPASFTRLSSTDRPHLVDGHTRTFWGQGTTPATLVEAAAGGSAADNRVATLVADHESGAGDGRPRANPAFSEAVFFELMRARQYQRAFMLLAPECQQSWGSVQRFIDAQRIGSLASLRGVRVDAVRHLESWRDPESGIVHDHAAELDVQYSVAGGDRQVTVPRTVHLVAHAGGWRSLCYPTA